MDGALEDKLLLLLHGEGKAVNGAGRFSLALGLTGASSCRIPTDLAVARPLLGTGWG